ncbi:alanine/glycine:cation symporter family protein [Anaerococcus hydrogenalis]|uniref:Sodium:alanine symporter family protein n=1 Tax=Anaerococcus hydrogenalis TaxID=33029 RepID=A0A2N6UL15_9FIRM|nr:sodium:alanine symporter family protein [Anaerococcus hydrogenalis]MDK7694508.1 sodium:alanine symporter family protein [Anaerococcus hydrogenalis]MDK7696286.1 sodium:alanine symporter family protein [Anaerococcus hydrogenalis]MDK7707535.1 sodium:alanine symporter family protein [Anaerococcus hydrogenalis]PMC82548.1 sodium:alanine symporter family protein [Anaerococcus hydrogenalis]
MIELLKSFENLLWGLPLIIGIIGTGIYISLKTKAIQFRKLPYALKNTLGKILEKPNKENKGDISPFGALATALAATVGTGNIVGVSLAIILGGPGAIFWMWLAALLGMATKFSEVTLALAFREKKNGQYVGGPMYYIEKGLNNKKLAKTFAIFAGIAVFGIGDSTQANAIANVLHDSFGINTIISGFILSILAGIVIVGGINSITKVTEKLVPLMSFLYIVGCLWILILNKANILPAFKSIFVGAFNPKSLGGSFAGLSVKAIISAGVARGVFTNEAGLGSSPMAHACASTDHPVRQGLWGISEIFVDTIIICTMTALVILSTNVDITDTNNAASLVARAFATGSSIGNLIVSLGLSLFAFSTILGWAYYGETTLRYLFGEKIIIPYRIFYVIFVFLGANMDLGLVWIVANILNGLMALPNLYALINLSPIVVKLSKDFFKNPKKIRKSPSEYNFLLKND